MQADAPIPMTTNLPLHAPLRKRINEQAELDKRTMKQEIVVLIEEALDRREKRK